MKIFLKFISLLKNHHKIYQQKNIQNTRLHSHIIEDHWGQIIFPATTAWRIVFISKLSCSHLHKILWYLGWWSTWIQVSIVLIDTVRKPSVEPIEMAKWWGIIIDKMKNTIQVTTQREVRSMLQPSLSRWFRKGWKKSLLLLPGTSCVFRHNFWQSIVHKRQQNLHKYMPQFLDGLEFSQWHPKVKHMRPCYCQLPEIIFHQLVYTKLPMRWSNVSFNRGLTMLHVSWWANERGPL